MAIISTRNAKILLVAIGAISMAQGAYAFDYQDCTISCQETLNSCNARKAQDQQSNAISNSITGMLSGFGKNPAASSAGFSTYSNAMNIVGAIGSEDCQGNYANCFTGCQRTAHNGQSAPQGSAQRAQNQNNVSQARNKRTAVSADNAIDDYKKGIAAFKNKDYAEAFKWYMKAAQKGLKEGQFVVGKMYVDGLGAPQDYAAGIKWYTRAALQDMPAAQFALGEIYETGHGVPQNYAQAVKWYIKAAGKDHTGAQFNLGTMYENGHGVQQDKAEAATWYAKAAAKDHPGAQFGLGLLYAQGEGVKQDDIEAEKWLKKATDQGDVNAQAALEAVSRKEGASAAALKFGDAAIAFDKGLYAEKEQDFSAAFRWFKMAADQGDVGGEFYLAQLYTNGSGITQDYGEAARWFKKAADAGNNKVAQYYLGTLYRDGKGVEKNLDEAEKWLKRSADQGFVPAQKELAALEQGDKKSSGLGAVLAGIAALAALAAGAAAWHIRNKVSHSLENLADKTTHPLRAPLIRIGRHTSNDVVLQDQTASRYHALLCRHSAGHFFIKNEDSSNGVFVNDRQVNESALSHGDIIRIGETMFRFHSAKRKAA